MTNEKPKDTEKHTSAFTALMPGRKEKLRIWAIRSVIVILAAYLFVRMGVGAWFIWAAWAYVALTLVLAFVLTRPSSDESD